MVETTKQNGYRVREGVGRVGPDGPERSVWWVDIKTILPDMPWVQMVAYSTLEEADAEGAAWQARIEAEGAAWQKRGRAVGDGHV